MKKLSQISESVWNDIRKRGNGTEIKQEDDINNLDVDGLYDYVKDKYKEQLFYVDLDSFGQGQKMVCVDPVENVSLYTKYDKQTGKMTHILISWIRVHLNKDFIWKVYDRFQVEKTNPYRLCIKEKDGRCTNQTYIDLIDIFIDNINNVIVNESVWGDIRKRGNGTERKKEDDIDLLNMDDFCDYLKSKYWVDTSKEQRPSKIFAQKIGTSGDGGFISVPLFVFNGKNVNNVQDVSDFMYYPSEKEIGFGCTSKKYTRIFLDLLGERFAKRGGGIKLNKETQYFSGNITNKTLIEMIDFVIDNINKPLIPVIVKK